MGCGTVIMLILSIEIRFDVTSATIKVVYVFMCVPVVTSFICEAVS